MSTCDLLHIGEGPGDCPRAVVWTVTTRCCGAVAWSCDTCRSAFLLQIDKYTLVRSLFGPDAAKLRCHRCKADWVKPDWEVGAT